jgi:hypothetical protein
MKSIAISLIILMTATSVVHAENYVMKQVISSNTSSVAPTNPTLEDENEAILAKADETGDFNGYNGGYSGYGSMWIGYKKGELGAVSKFSASNPNAVFVVKSRGGKYFTYSGFSRSTMTLDYSFQASQFYINGKPTYPGLNIDFATIFEGDAVVRHEWNPATRGYDLHGTYYMFNNPDFPIDRVWTE